MEINKHFELLGLLVKDKITGITGTVSSISFDLYGCIQAVINRGLDKDGKQLESNWFDVIRLQRLNNEPIIQRPEFSFGPIAKGHRGPSEKPKYSKP